MAGNTDQYVVDASFCLALLLPDENLTTDADKLFKDHINGSVQFISTPFLPFEVLNGLKTAVLRKRIKKALAIRLVDAFIKLAINLKEVNYLENLENAFKNGLTVYDASYLTLAKNENMILLTLDRDLTRSI